MFRRRALCSIFSSLLLVLTASAHAHTRPRYGGVLRVEMQGEPWDAPGSVGRRLVYDSLTRIDDSGEPAPALATRWSAQNNNHRWQFWIRPGVRFHDGSPLTPEAVEQALQRSCTQCPWNSVRRLNDSVVFLLPSADPVFPAELARSAFAITGAGEPAAGTGAFRFVSASADGLALAAVDDAWQGRPFVDKVQVTGHRTIRSQILDLSSGQADVIEIPAELIRQAQQEHVRILASQPCDLLLLTLSTNGALRDEAQRESIALAVDRQALFNTIFQKQGEMSASLLAGGLSGYGFLFPVARDLARAQTLHGAASLVPLSLVSLDASPAAQLSTERIALNLKDAGFRVQVLPHDATGTPELTLRRIHIESSEAGAALEEALGTLGSNQVLESTEPAAVYREETAFLQTHTVVPLLYLPRAYGEGSRVRGFHLTADGMPDLADVSLE